MPQLRTDDGPRKLRAVWLGPKGATLPFQWTYVQWLVTLISIPVVVGLIWIVLSALQVPYPAAWAVPWGTAAAMYGSVKVMSQVSYDEPLRHLQQVTRREWRDGAVLAPEPVVLTVELPTFGYLDADLLARKGWNTPEQRPRGLEAGQAERAVRPKSRWKRPMRA